MAKSLTNQTVYKLGAILGIAIVLLVPFISWTHIAGLEPRATRAFEQYILADLDKRSLSEQLKSIEFAMSQSTTDSEIAVNYSPAELGALAREAKQLGVQIEQRFRALEMLDDEKRSIVAEIRLTIAATIVVLAIGMVFTIFGFIAWYFHIQILEDRRETPRD